MLGVGVYVDIAPCHRRFEASSVTVRAKADQVGGACVYPLSYILSNSRLRAEHMGAIIISSSR